ILEVSKIKTPGYCASFYCHTTPIRLLSRFSVLLDLQRRHVRGTIFGTWRLTNSIRPLCGHPPSIQILALASAQKPSPLISVELVGGQEFLDDMETGELCNRNRGMFTSRTEKSHNILYPAFVCRAQVSTIYRPIRGMRLRRDS